MWDIFVVFSAQVIYVSLMTLRWIFLLKGQRYQAAALSVVEVIIWVYALALVVGHLNDPLRLLAYALGYATGSLVGTWLEARLAFGFITVQVITKAEFGLPRALRESGFGVTSWRGSGRDGDREILMVVARRRWGTRLYEIIDRIAPQAFVLAIEPRGFRGGFLTRRLPPVPAGIAMTTEEAAATTMPPPASSTDGGDVTAPAHADAPPPPHAGPPPPHTPPPPPHTAPPPPSPGERT